jgi:hypothetical protein
MTIESPELRATVRGDRVRMIDRVPWLVEGGPMWTLMEDRGRAGVAIADVAVLRDDDGRVDEAVVHFLTGDSPGARGALRDWAGRVGYRRVWLPDDVVELPGPAPDDQVADVRCTGCRVLLCDTGGQFWGHVRSAGRFPTACPLCGCDLPQWRVRSREIVGACRAASVRAG